MSTATLPDATAPVVALEVRAVRKSVENGDALPGRVLDLPSPASRVDALPVHTWLPRLSSERGQRRVDVWGFAARERCEYHTSIESHSVRVDVHWSADADRWPDPTVALGFPGRVWTGALPKSKCAAARGLLSVRADTQERSLDLNRLLYTQRIAAPTSPDAKLSIRATVVHADDPAMLASARSVAIEAPNGERLPCWLTIGWDHRREPLDPTRITDRYLLLTLAFAPDDDPELVPTAADALLPALHRFAAHEVLVRAASAINDELSMRIHALLDDETELHRVDNIKRDIAHLQREFTDELEAGWAFDERVVAAAGDVLSAIASSTELRIRWESQRKRFDRLAAIADFAPTVGPPVAGPRDHIGGSQVGAADARQIRMERRIRRQVLMAYSRWWRGRALYHEGQREPDDDSRCAAFGPIWGRVYNVFNDLDVRIDRRMEARADEEQRRATQESAEQAQRERRRTRRLFGSPAPPPGRASHRPRIVELHPFRNRSYLFEELNGAIQRTTFLAAATLVFLGAVLQTPGGRPVSQVDLLLVFLAIFGFLFSTLMFGRLTTRVARRTTIDYDGRFRTADRVSDYLGVFPLLLALPLIIFRFIDTGGLRIATAILAIIATAFHLRLSSRLHIDVSDSALSTSRFRAVIGSAILISMTVALFAAVDQVPGAWLTTFVSIYVMILVFLALAAGIVPPWSDDVHYGEVPAMRDGQYAVHPWDALSEESPDYYRRTFGSDYQGDPVGHE